MAVPATPEAQDRAVACCVHLIQATCNKTFKRHACSTASDLRPDACLNRYIESSIVRMEGSIHDRIATAEVDSRPVDQTSERKFDSRNLHQLPEHANSTEGQLLHIKRMHGKDRGWPGSWITNLKHSVNKNVVSRK